jgi:branched-chain amino acid aminotransferase
MANIIFYINGDWVSENNAKIPFNDAGFLYGDGLFETVRFQNRKLFRPQMHINRLRSGLKILSLHLPINDQAIISILEKSIEKNQIVNGLLRMIITRGFIHKGFPWNHTGTPGLYVSIRPLSSEPEIPVKIVYLKESSFPLIRFKPAIKSVNYLGNMLAKKEAEKQGAFEPVFINSDGFITEGAIRNVFYIKDDKLLSPGLDLGVLPGIMRSSIIEISKKTGLIFSELHIHIDEISSMDEAFISSTGIGILPCNWENWSSNHTNTQILRKYLTDLIEGIE